MKTMSNGQRALWTVLITSLSAPFFASLIAVALRFVGPLSDYLLPFETGAPIGDTAVDAFAWSALPATVAAVGLSPFVLQHGTYTWLQAAVAGVIGFAAGAIIFPLAGVSPLPFLAFIAGLLSIAMRAVLAAGGILRSDAKS